MEKRAGNSNCCVVGCSNAYYNTDSSVKFYRFPGRWYEKERREIWINSVRRLTPDKKRLWKPQVHDRICSAHFVGNCKSEHPLSLAYNPTIFPKEYTKYSQPTATATEQARQHPRKLQGHPHVFTCHNDVPEIYRCVSCEFGTRLRVSLTNHFGLNHKEPRYQNQFEYAMRQCEYCAFETYSALLLLKHCIKCDKRHLSDRTINWLECEHCPYKTKDEQELCQHTNIEHTKNIKRFNCNKCSYKTKWRQGLQRHLKIMHTDSANVVWHHCDKCEFKTKWKQCLKKHLVIKHTHARNVVWYHCDKCEHKTKRKNNLKQHMISIHLGSA